MTLRTVAPLLQLAPHDCGRAPSLVQSIGRTTHNARLAGMPLSQYHVECAQCEVTTAPVYSQAVAEVLWRQRTTESLHPLAELTDLRRKAEAALAAA